ncbi:MAG: ABC transporter ATP-binding protein, partial [Bacillota bacterium]|nr:ABC transporter ATP-binding protein [Bacillota bacterium]
HYRNLHAWNPKLFYLGIFRLVPDMLIPIFAVLLPTMVVKGLEEKWNVAKYAGYVGGLMVIMLLFNLINSRVQMVLKEEKENYRFKYLSMLCDKKMDIDYDILETQDFQNKQSLAFYWIAEWGDGPIERCISSPGAIASCVIGMAIYGTMLAKQSGWILLFIMASVLVSIAMAARALRHEDDNAAKSAKVRRKLRYINNQVMDFSVGKDIRLFGMKKWFLNMYHTLLKENETFLSIQQLQYYYSGATDEAMVFVRDIAAYIYLIYQIANGKLTVSDFVLYTSLVTGFSVWFRKCVEEIQWLARGGYAFHAIRECFEVQNKWKGNVKKAGEKINSEKAAVSIELKNVSFSYSAAGKPTLSNINLKIEKGEKVALVGLNGAGKTTLVKLLCGFYHPTEGEILVNGVPIHEYDREEYYSMVSAVFQDAQLLPISIADNISCERAGQSDPSKIEECLYLSGLKDKTEKLPQGEKTLLVRELSSEAVDLSGGEKQKLLLSRALYKEASFLILDEPTAALDPIAENEIYLKYRDLTADKTSLFISHRLSSTRFCDRIILLENGEIVEEGTHDALMEADGQYANMFEIQSRYYKEEAEEKERTKKIIEGGDIIYV